MKKILITLSILSVALFADIKIDTTYSTLGAIAQKIGQDKVDVTVLGSSKYDPHFIVPKPSLLAKLRRADLLIINGGGLELGWLPPLIRSANNAKIQNGAKGFLDISHSIPMIDIPSSVSRGFGDIHAEGNPHYSTDPHLVLIIANTIEKKLEELDFENASYYKKNLTNFRIKWNNYLQKVDTKMQSCKGEKVVQYHELFNYFLKRYKIKSYGNIEPLPGIAPSSKHTIKLINLMKKENVKMILQDVYHEKKTAKFIASKTNAKVVIVPHDQGAVGGKTLQEYYNNIANAICR
jgi:zinc/manganese transport system substrate-binding protein